MKYNWHRIQFAIMSLVIVFAGYCNSVAQNENFPLPESLKPNVKFWIGVYAKYTSDHIVIHDNVRMDIIYEIVNVDTLFPESVDYSDKMLWKRIETIKDKYRDILLKLARMNVSYPESLSEKERQVYQLFGTNPSPVEFRVAADRIRGQQGLKEQFLEGLIRSGRYLKFMEETYKKHGLPLELTALPHVESSFNNSAYSKFGAAGLWQFTRSTGRQYLKIDYTVDERFDPEKATESAARLLKRNYQTLGSWPLALTAYNHGVNGMKRAIQQVGSDDIAEIVQKYKGRSFKFASRNFYAEFLAALHVSRNYTTYFGDVDFHQPIDYTVLEVPSYMRISTITDKLSVTIDDIKILNPSLRRSVLQSERMLPKGFKLRIPDRDGIDIDGFYAHIQNNEKFDRQLTNNWYKVRHGDNLQKIAKQFSTSVNQLLALNNDIEDIHTIYVGQVLRVPEGGDTELASNDEPMTPIQTDVVATNQIKNEPEPVLETTNQSTPPTTVAADVKWYQVRWGDSLEQIAARFNMSIDDLMSRNQIADKDQIFVGQLLKLFDDIPEVNTEPALAFQDADSNDEFIEETPELEYYTVVDMDASIPNPVNPEPIDEPTSNGSWHTIARGETLEKIAQQYQVNFDDLMAINNIENKNLIRAGQTLIIPDARVPQPDEIDNISEIKTKGYYVVTPGDNLEKIAQKLQTTALELARINNLRNQDQIQIGQKLLIPDQLTTYASLVTVDIPQNNLVAEQVGINENSDNAQSFQQKVERTSDPKVDYIFVMPEETLGHFADWLEIRTQELRNINGLKYSHEIQLGQKIKIVYSNVLREEFEQRRMEYHRVIEEDFFASFRIDSVQTHLLRSGENIWQLCNDVYEVPYWLFIKYNPHLNINRLRNGEKINIPIISEKSVASTD
ncbi:LysM peptidoglycan-binding domain-containing protein [candidate division KSB1 bacterium]|nr:LysM peptidoglycan-binding domain-containing protein [candidate division KSB1 bacterium]